MATGDKLIQVKDLKKYYNRGAIKALDGVTVDIDQGDVMVVIGPSGSGKSTFLRSLNLLEEPTSGTITFEGVDITDPKNDINKLRARMGMVFQQFNLFPHMTVKQNITLAPTKLKLMTKAQADKKALELLERVGRKRGMLVSGGEVNTERAAITVLDEYRGGKLGRITLERP